MTLRKPVLPSAVYDALPKDVAADYNRADEIEPAAPVAVVINVNLNYDVQKVVEHVARTGNTVVSMPVGVNHTVIAAQVESVRVAIANAMRGGVA